MSNENIELKHSGLGIASLIVSIFAAVSEFTLIVAAGIMGASSHGGIDENEIGVMILGFFIIGGFMLALSGFILGLAGLFQKYRKKIFPALGLAFNIIIMTAVAGLILIGIIVG